MIRNDARARLRATPYDPELAPGARNAVRTCLKVQPTERVVLIADDACRAIAASLAAELEAVGAPFVAFVLEELAPRPLTDLPAEVLVALDTCQVSIFAVQVQPGELRSRMQMTDLVNARGIRHAHMVNITEQILRDGMRADYDAVDALSKKVLEIVRRASIVRATTPAGTDLVVQLTPAYQWIKTSGIISAKKWGNLPGGEIFTTPQAVNGTFVVDGVVGDFLCARYGALARTPLTVTIDGSRLTSARCPGLPELERDFWEYCHTDENSDRVGEFALGTNIGLTGVIGNILQDEKVPGIHIAFGNPYGFHTGADWISSTHIDIVGLNFDIWADDRQIMKAGRYLV